jgi:hypothetical protein
VRLKEGIVMMMQTVARWDIIIALAVAEVVSEVGDDASHTLGIPVPVLSQANGALDIARPEKWKMSQKLGKLQCPPAIPGQRTTLLGTGMKMEVHVALEVEAVVNATTMFLNWGLAMRHDWLPTASSKRQSPGKRA